MWRLQKGSQSWMLPLWRRLTGTGGATSEQRLWTVPCGHNNCLASQQIQGSFRSLCAALAAVRSQPLFQ